MKVDRHNYEEYFLLYVDNELTGEQKRQVELFIQENPDLEEELVMLQQSRLIPETILFEEKHLLMKEENNSFINFDNYEEWLVLYVDNELNDEEKTIVEEFAATHPRVQAELNLFAHTKLQPDELNFPDKNLLYRNKDEVRIIKMTWWRVAAAAILIIAAGITLYSVLDKENNRGPQLTEENVAGSQKVQIPNSVKSVTSETQQQKQDNPVIEQEKVQVAVNSTSGDKQNQKKNREQPYENVSQSNQGQALVNSNIPQKRPVFVNEMNYVKPKELPISDAVVVTDKPKQFINDPTVTPPPPKTPNLPEYASNTENKKLRGLFRKATRFIERTSGINPANDDNRVLIGGMAINLK